MAKSDVVIYNGVTTQTLNTKHITDRAKLWASDRIITTVLFLLIMFGFSSIL